MDRYDHGDAWGWSWVAMAGFMTVIAVAVILAVVWVVRARPLGGAPSEQASTDAAERILAERFARGEIDADEFTARRDLLRKR